MQNSPHDSDRINLHSDGASGTLAPSKIAAMRILIVEDEPDLQRGLARALRDEGYAVDTADNGEDGLFNAESTDYDAIVLDVMLPKLDGWSVLARLGSSEAKPLHHFPGNVLFPVLGDFPAPVRKLGFLQGVK